MPGTYFDGDTSGSAYAWTGTPNLSSSTYTVSVTSTGTPGIVGELVAGSWSVGESASPVDILDTNGSTGQVSATFKNQRQAISSSPGATPAASSDYIPGRPCTYTHDSFGSITGNILDASPKSSTVDLNLSTPLSVLNVNLKMPQFSEGSYFYSWKRTFSDGKSLGGIRDIAVNSDGNIWIVGNLSGTNALRLYDRFGNFVRAGDITGTGLAVEVDTAGNIYVLTSTQLHKYDSTGAFLSTIVTVSGYTLVKMTIDNSNNLWVASTSPNVNQAIKKFTSTGTLLAQYGTYSPATIPPTGTSYNSYTGMAMGLSNTIQIGNSAPDGQGATFYYYNKIDIASGITTGPFFAGIQNSEYAPLGMDWARTIVGGALAFKMVYFSQTGLYDDNNNYMNTKIKADPRLGGALACDNAGGGYWLAVDDTVYRVAGGTMGTHQAMECYMGAAGYRGSISYATNTPFQQLVSDRITVPSWEGNVWSKLKELAARAQRTITTDGAGIRIARNDTRLDENRLDISNRESAPNVSIGQPGAQVINVTAQNVGLPDSGHGLLYAMNMSDPLIEVDFGQVYQTTLQGNFYAVNIDTPSQSYRFGINAIVNPNTFPSQYFICDSSYPPKQVTAWDWAKIGGSLDFKLSDITPGAIDVTMTGPNYTPDFVGPFSLAYTLGTTKYSFLTFSGYGFTTSPQEFQVYTGAPFNTRAEIDSQDLNSVFLDTQSAAWDMARMSSATLGSGSMTCSVSIPVSSITVPFGQIAGSYFYWKRNYWRVTDASIHGGWVDINASRDTRVADVQDGSITHGSIDNTWGGYRYLDNYLSPGVLGA